MMKKIAGFFKKFTLTEFLFVLVIIAALSYFSFEPCTLDNAQLTARVINTSQIAYAVAAYANDHNSEFPGKWSDLQPSVIHKDEGYLFLKNLRPRAGANPPPPTVVDMNAAYCLAECQAGMWIIYERPGIWEDGKVTWCWVSAVDGKWIKGQTGKVS